MYWNVNDTLSYNALFNFVVSNRGAGKSYGTKEYAINRFKKNKEQFVYLRRFATELKKCSTFFNDICARFPEDKFEVKGRTFYINDEVAGYAIALSKGKIEKSNSYPDVTTIIFDEFILDKGYHRYLNDEVVTFLELYETVARKRNNVRVFFLGNAITFTNPYFLYFNIKPPENKKSVRVKDDILIQLWADAEFIEEKKETRFGKIISGTDYGKYAIENVNLRDNDSFVCKMPEKPFYYFTLKTGGVFYGVWLIQDKSKVFISEKYDPSCGFVIVTTLDDHTPNTLLLKGIVKHDKVKTLSNAFKYGLLWYESVKVKNVMQDTLRYLGG